MSSTRVVQQRARLWHCEAVVGMMIRVKGKSKSVSDQCGLSKVVSEESCYKYLCGAQPCLQVSALLL